MNLNNYRNLLAKKYMLIYGLYFTVFFAIGSIDKTTAIFFDGIKNGEVIYGFILSAFSIVNIIIPTISGALSSKYSAKKVSIYYFVLCILLSFGMVIFKTNIFFLD